MKNIRRKKDKKTSDEDERKTFNERNNGKTGDF